MRCRTLMIVLVAVAYAGGCTTTGSTPATAPSTSATATTPTSAPTSSTAGSTTSEVVPTTIDRLGEVTTIFEDLERRRLDAIYTGDAEAFTALFADTAYLDRSLEVFDLVAPGTPPTVSIEILEILRDDDDCLVMYYTASRHGEQSEPATAVLEVAGDTHRYAFTSAGRGGWMCDGPHPLSP